MKNALILQLVILCGTGIFGINARAADDGPCEPTTIIRNYFWSGSSGVYGCTIKKNTKGIITAWMWEDKAVLTSEQPFRIKYAFNCYLRVTQKLEEEYSGLTDDEWVKPQKGTIADQWLTYICRQARFN